MPDPSDPLEVQPIVGDEDDDELIAEVEIEPDDAPLAKPIAPAAPAQRRPGQAASAPRVEKPASVAARTATRAPAKVRGKQAPLGLWIGLAIGGLVVVGLIILGIAGFSRGGSGASPANAENPFEI